MDNGDNGSQAICSFDAGLILGSTLITMEQRHDALVKQTSRWIRSLGQSIPSDYLHYVPSNLVSVQIYGDKDPERIGRAELCSIKKNKFRVLYDETNPPPNVVFEHLTKEQLQSSFVLEPDPKVKKVASKPVDVPVKIIEAPPPQKRSTPAPAAPQPKRNRVDSGEFSDSSTGKMASSARNAIRLENELRRAIESLFNVPFTKKKGGDFSMYNFPYNNPFALPIERGMSGLPDEYFEKISKPCDLSKIKSQVDRNYYTTVEAFEKDVDLISSNALAYHPKGSDFFKAAVYFKKEAKKIVDAMKVQLR